MQILEYWKKKLCLLVKMWYFDLHVIFVNSSFCLDIWAQILDLSFYTHSQGHRERERDLELASIQLHHFWPLIMFTVCTVMKHVKMKLVHVPAFFHSIKNLKYVRLMYFLLTVKY